LFGQRLQHCAEKDHPHCYEEAKISGQPDLFMQSALQILLLTSRKHLCTAPDIYSFFGVASSTGQGKSKQIRQWLKIRPLSFQWGLPSKFDSNPLIWMLTLNGMLVDVRHLPIEVQEEAYQKGLIPYVPGAKHS
jgi:hypothetical protein